MAARLAPGDYDQLHHFIADGVWDAAPLESELLVQADRLVGGKDVVLVIDDTAMPKKGDRSINLHPSWNHALRTARITSVNPSGSTSPPARSTTSPITISTVSLRIDSKRVNLTAPLGDPPNGATAPEVIALRRHANSCDGSCPLDRAIADTFVPATNDLGLLLIRHDR
jgi:hypothetical protein